MSAEEKFWANVSPGRLPPGRPDLGPCWAWTGLLNDKGYGLFKPPGGLRSRAHRWSFEAAGRQIPAGLVIDHLCRVRNCVRPSHLEAVTQGVNVLRGDAPSAKHARKTHCINGHPFDEANTYIIKSGGRMCKTCRRERMRRYSAERRSRSGSSAEASVS